MCVLQEKKGNKKEHVNQSNNNTMRHGTQLFINEANLSEFSQLISNIKQSVDSAFEEKEDVVACFETSLSRGPHFMHLTHSPPFEDAPVPHPFMNNFVYVNKEPVRPVWGFGTSLTDASVEQLNSMPLEIADQVLNLQLGLQGLKRIRIPIGSCDFRPDSKPYSFARNELENVEIPESTDSEVHWQFWKENFEFNANEGKRVLWLKRMQEQHGEIHITAAPWSAPPKLKTNTRNAEPQGWIGGELDYKTRPQVLVSWVNYLLYYVVQYEAEFGLRISSLSLQNEPRMLPSIFAQTWETMFFTGQELAEMTTFAIERIRELGLKVRLILFDDQKALLPDWIAPIMRAPCIAEEVGKGKLGMIEAVGFHGYMWPGGSHKSIRATAALYPTVPLVCTEFTTGFSRILSWPIGPEKSGSSSHARQLLGNTMLDIQSGSSGFIDWNMVLNIHGGPNWSSNFCDGPLLWDKDAKHLIVQLACMFLTHITAFMGSDAQVIECASAGTSAPQAVAFKSRNKLVVVVNNTDSWFYDYKFYMVVNGRTLKCTVPKGSVQTYVF